MKRTHKTPAELERDARSRDEEAHRRHVAAIQAEKQRMKALLPVPMRERIARWGPSLWDLMIAIDGAIEASDPLRGAPTEDVSRVSRPSSEGDEGASTRRSREKMADYQREMAALASKMAQTFGVDLPDRRDFGMHIRWHVNRDKPARNCRYCLDTNRDAQAS